jgi:hypothetical protein
MEGKTSSQFPVAYIFCLRCCAQGPLPHCVPERVTGGDAAGRIIHRVVDNALGEQTNRLVCGPIGYLELYRGG